MSKINQEREFRKIAQAFIKVKGDMNQFVEYINKLQRENQEQSRMILELQEEIKNIKEANLNKSESKNPQIVGNIESKRFHYETCPYAKNIKSDNKVRFENIEKAVKSGYQECSCIRE